MTETEPQYKWVPVTAADEWWKLPAEELRFAEWPVLSTYYARVIKKVSVVFSHYEGRKHTSWVGLNEPGITRRVRVEQEKDEYRYFRFCPITVPIHRVSTKGTDEVLWFDEWVPAAVPQTIQKYLQSGWPECDKDGKPLATAALASAVQTPEFQGQVKDAIESAKPARAVPPDLNAANYPAWAVWCRHFSWSVGERSAVQGVNSGGLVNGPTWRGLTLGGWYLGDTEGNWYDVPKNGGGE